MKSRLRSVVKHLWYVVPVAAAYALISFFADSWAMERRKTQPELPMAPAFALPLVEPEAQGPGAKVVSSEELRGGPVVLNFWASWCVACMDEKPYLDAIWKKRKNKRYGMYAIATGDDWAAVQRTGRVSAEHFPILFDTDGKVAEAFAVKTLPVTIVLDNTGRVLYRHDGPVSSQAAIGAVERMLSRDVQDSWATH